MKCLLIAPALLLIGVLTSASMAQSVTCPDGMVCVSRAVAEKALQDADTVEAQKKEITVKDQAIADLKKLLDDVRIQFAAVSGENTALKQNAVSDRAIMTILLQNTKKKCLPFTICL